MDRRRVVITGLGAVTPIGLTALESWQAVKNGVCGVAPITQFDPSGMKVKLAAEVKGFEAETLLGRQEAKRMGRFTQFAVVAAREAISDAGFDIKNADPDRCGVIISSGIGGLSITEAEHDKGKEKGWDRVSPFYIPTGICNMAAGQVAIDHGFKGMCTCPVTACAGGPPAGGGGRGPWRTSTHTRTRRNQRWMGPWPSYPPSTAPSSISITTRAIRRRRSPAFWTAPPPPSGRS